MYMNKIFQEIASDENGIYHSQNQSFFGFGMSKTPMTKHHLEIEYSGCLMKVYYELGNYNLAKIETHFSRNTYIPEFQIKTTNHYRRLFNRKLNSLIIETNEVDFKRFLEAAFIKTELEQIARDNSFQPKMFTKLADGSLKFITEYSLEFPDKIKALKSMIKLYKLLIDRYV